MPYDSVSSNNTGSSRLGLVEIEADDGLDTSKVVSVSVERKKCLLNFLKYSPMLFVVCLACAMIPSAFLIANNSHRDSIQSQNTMLQRLNEQLFIQMQNLSQIASQMSSENVELRVDLEYLSNMMRESKESLLSYFDTQFYSFSNKSVQYALVEYDEVVAWNLGDQMCKAVQSQLAFPVAGNHESIEDLIAACPFDTQTNCCTCWVGLNKQEDGKTWFDSDGNEVKNVEELPWATGQPTDTTGYDCAYIRDAYLFNKNCQGTAVNSSGDVVSERVVCQSIIF
ncbi:uncharacterized protein LOC134842595 isoform X3 [Symsagittifera roscoffensis]|uniref:uncharacterized protein LOC134842595 isoform X3 n=1 Tax=Symsagittifera roscoffensis TaxID=84072 RepID=UPI00307BE05D